MKKIIGIVILLTLFTIFTYLLTIKDLDQVEYVILFISLLVSGLSVLFYERVKEVIIGNSILRLYGDERQLELDKITMAIAEILIKLEEQTPGTAKNRKEREQMIDNLLESINADMEKRRKILENSKLITKLMATNNENELQNIRDEINKRDLFD